MIFDHRTYTVKPGNLPKQLQLYESTARRRRSATSASPCCTA